MASILPIFINSALEHMSHVWLELALASLAAFVYFGLSGLGKSSKSKSLSPRNQKQEQLKNVEIPTMGEHELTPVQLATKALRQGKLIEALEILQDMPEVVAGQMPDGLAQRFLMVIPRMSRSPEVMTMLKAFEGKISAEALEVAVADFLKGKDVQACCQLHALSNTLSIPKSEQSLQSFAYAYSADASALRALVEEVAGEGLPLSTPFAAAVLETSAAQTDTGLVEDLLGKVDESDLGYLRDLLEKSAVSPKTLGGKTLPAVSGDGSESDSSPQDGNDEGSSEITSLKNAISSITPGSKHLSSKEIAMRANDIRSCGKNGDLRGAAKVFKRLGAQSEHPLLVNSMVEACIECSNFEAAQECFDQARKLGVADAAVYNTMMKSHIAKGEEPSAKVLLAELSEKGMVATRSSFHGLLNARVNAKDMKGAWKLVEEMKAVGLQPNAVTCSILMKGRLQSLSDVARVLTLIDTMDQPMDEVLFLSVVESCIRTGRLDLLARQFDKFLKQSPNVQLSAPTFGTMIKAYGHARDTKRVWDLWNQMLAHGARPTAITLGCMVEALVANGCTLDAWHLTQDMWKGEATRPLVNTVIYSSILKGFAHHKETDKVMALYDEMQANNIQPNTITYNTILNAFAQGGAMNRVPKLLEDMKAANPPVEPDIVTYSTIVKGFCNTGSLDRALKVLKDMKASGKYAPDEVMYNSLLSGCAKEHRPDEALQLLNDMKKTGVAPSNYTLSMLVKLMGRCKRLNQAFVMLEDISREYDLKINVQVYTCLIQGCFNANQPGKAIALHAKIIGEGLHPDAMTYTVLVRGCIQSSMLEKAVALARTAYGIPAGLPQSRGSPPGLTAGCFEEVIDALGGLGNAAAKELDADIGHFRPAAAKYDGNRAPAKHQKGQGGGRGGGNSAARGSQPARAANKTPAAQAPWRAAKPVEH